MPKAWEKLLEIVREAEGVGSGTGEVKPKGNGRAEAEDDDEDEDDMPVVGTWKEKADAWERYGKGERKRSARYRTRAKDAESALASQVAAKDAEITALKKARDDAVDAARTETKALGDKAVGEAKTAAEKRIISIETKYALKEAGCTDIAAALKLVDGSAIKMTEAGEPEGVAESVAKLKTASPYLFSVASSTTSTTKTAPDPKTTEAKKVADMSAEEYAAARAKLTKTPTIRR